MRSFAHRGGVERTFVVISTCRKSFLDLVVSSNFSVFSRKVDVKMGRSNQGLEWVDKSN